MSTESPEFPAIDRDKSPLLDADHDLARVADALRSSPHVFGARTVAGQDRVTFTTAAGNGFDLSVHGAEPATDDLPAPGLTEALAAAILNHPDFVVAEPSPRQDTITVQTRGGIRYLLALDVDPDADTGADGYPAPAEDVASAADHLLTSDPSDVQRATAELLNYVAATWDHQDLPLRQHATAVARSLRQTGE
jgi:hypothetical protein